MLEVMQGHMIYFFGFKTIDGHTNANSISKVLLEELHVVCSPDSEFDKGRLITQTSDGASVRSIWRST